VTADIPSDGSDAPVGVAPLYDPMKRHQIEVLVQAGFSLRAAARKAGISRNTVKRILRNDPPLEADRRPVGRPPIAVPFEGSVRAVLTEQWDLPTVEVLRRLRHAGYTGGKNPVYQLVRRLRRTLTAPLIRFEGLPGEFVQCDFGHVRIGYDDGTTEILHFFAARLKWSRWVYVELVENEQVESLVRALLSAFESFGGVPLSCVFDNPKTVVLSRQGGVIHWNPTFSQVALDYRFGPELCTPRSGWEKGSVENLVGFVKNGFFLVRRFHDRADLESQLAEWHHDVNEVRPCRATGVPPSTRIAEERRRLRPLPIPSSDYALRFPVRVGPTGWVTFHGVRYSMPAEALGLPATLFLYRDDVRIMTDRFDERHPRRPHNGVSTLPKHATSALAAVSGRRAELYYQRQRVLEVGPIAETFLTELVHARPHTWPPEVRRLFALLQEHGPERMVGALREAVERGWHDVGLIETLLTKPWGTFEEVHA
jgi:transposase